MAAKYLAKRFMADLMHLSGVLGILSSKRFKGRGVILMYHRVVLNTEEHGVPLQPGMYVLEHTFERQVRFLKERFHVVSLPEMVAILRLGKDMSGYCAITFDDGWRDNFTNAYPILKKHDMPATVFLATDYIDTDKWFWPEEVSWCVSQYHDKGMIPALADTTRIGQLHQYGSCPIDKKFLIHTVIERLKEYSPADRDEVLRVLKASFPGRVRERLLMSWEEANSMFDSGLISFASHTAGHEMLDQIDKEKVHRELESSKKSLKDMLGIDSPIFAYPNGRMTDEAVSKLEELNYTAAVTTQRGYVLGGTSLFGIPRIGIHEDVSNTTPLFLARLTSGVF